MRLVHSTLLASVAFMIAAPALAADMRAPISKAPPLAPAAVYSWNGFYIGGNVGWGRGDNDVALAPSPDAASQTFWNGAFNAGAVPSNYPLEMDGVFGGGQIGYNVQNGAFVFGVEADLQGSGIKDALAINTTIFQPISTSASQQLDWFGTVRGRLGLAAGSALFYVTGGLAYGGVKYAYNMAAPTVGDFQSLSVKNTEVGWTIGGGIEWGFGNNWSAKAEYLFIDLGDQAFTTVAAGRAANLLTSFGANFENRYHTARIGLNYHFNYGAPLVAKY